MHPPKGYWILSDSQSEGVGRRARHWSSPQGNLYASLIVPFNQHGPALFQLPIIVSLALFEAVKQLAQLGVARDMRRDTRTKELDLRLKWPNDVLVNNKKIAGILIEKYTTPNQHWVIISFGINCVQTPCFQPESHSYPASSLTEQGMTVSAGDMFAALSDKVAVFLDLWHKGDHFDAMRKEWLDHAKGFDRRITARTHHETLEGFFAGLDVWGQLKLRLADGQIRTISNADIFYLDEEVHFD